MSFSVALINPKNNSYMSGEYIRGIRNDNYGLYPLSLATLGAVFKKYGIENIRIIDENIEDLIDDALNFDVIGITGFIAQKKSMINMAKKFRDAGKFLIAGGPLATVLPEELCEFFDSVFEGPIENILHGFIEDFKLGKTKKNYKSFSSEFTEDLFVSPDLSLITMNRYEYAAIQTTIGCPHRCEFCAVPFYTNKKIFTKPLDLVISELNDILRIKGSVSVFFADDNSFASKSYFRQLLKRLIEFQKKNRYPFRFSTEITILIAKEDDVLKDMIDAGFHRVFIGLETPNKDNLLEINKPFDNTQDVYKAIRKIQEYGITVDSGGIVGFDNDNQNVFNEQFEFFQNLSIPWVSSSLLHAVPKSLLYDRLKKEGRLIEDKTAIGGVAQSGDLSDVLATNFIPKNMTKEELIEGYCRLQEKLYSFDNYGKRLISYLKIPIGYMPKISTKKVHGKLKMIFKISFFYLIEQFPVSFIIYLKVLYLAFKTKRWYTAFRYLIFFKHLYTFHYKTARGKDFNTKYDRISDFFIKIKESFQG